MPPRPSTSCAADASRSRRSCPRAATSRSRRVGGAAGEEGEVMGGSWLFEPYRWHFDARAVEDGSLIAFDGACLRGKCDADHTLGYELMQRFAQVMIARLQRTRTLLLDVYGDGAGN